MVFSKCTKDDLVSHYAYIMILWYFDIMTSEYFNTRLISWTLFVESFPGVQTLNIYVCDVVNAHLLDTVCSTSCGSMARTLLFVFVGCISWTLLFLICLGSIFWTLSLTLLGTTLWTLLFVWLGGAHILNIICWFVGRPYLEHRFLCLAFWKWTCFILVDLYGAIRGYMEASEGAYRRVYGDVQRYWRLAAWGA